MRRVLVLLVAVLPLLPAAAGVPGEEERNLLVNGSFDEGAPGATKVPGWTEVDGLTTFFETEEGRGRVLRIDTDVNLVEADARWKEMELPGDKRPPAKPKGPTREPKYDTVGGTTGAKIWSDYVRVEPNMRYRLRADVKSDGTVVMIFVKGYCEFQGGFRKYYQWYKNVTVATGEWKTWEGTFNPTLKSAKVTHIRVMPYAYWPATSAWIDNVSVTRVGREEPGSAGPDGLIENGDFSRPTLAPWTPDGVAERADLGADGACGRVDAGGSMLSGLVPVKSGVPYRLTARTLPSGAVLEVAIDGVLKWEGKWTPLFTKTETVPAESEEWGETEVVFDPTAKTPQVTHVRVRFKALGEKGHALFDDVRIALASDGEGR